MANQNRGETELVLGGATFLVALNLGVLAELEDAFKVDSFEDALTNVFKDKMSARDFRKFMIALLKGNHIAIDEKATKAIDSIQPSELVVISTTLVKMLNNSGIIAQQGEVEQSDSPLSQAESAGSSG